MTEHTGLNEVEQTFVKWQRVARLATADAAGHPHVIPVCYAFDGQYFYLPLDEKPKRVAYDQLRRVRNILARGEASLVIDQYDDDWSQLGYVLISGHAGLLYPPDYRPADSLNGIGSSAETEVARQGTRVVSVSAGQVQPGEHASALRLLRQRYFQYRSMALEKRPLIQITPERVVSWGPALKQP